MTDQSQESSVLTELTAPADPTPPARKRSFRMVLRLAAPYWNGERKAKARTATLLLLLLTMGQVALSVWGNYWQRALYDALEQRSVKGVLMQVAVFLLILSISITVTCAHLLVKRWLQVDWRAWLTDRLTKDWLSSANHYRLNLHPGDHDNPDQRIAEDIHIATETAISLAHSLTFSVLTLGLFTNILWTISGGIDVPGTDVHISGYMVPLAFLYAIAGSTLGWIVGRPLVSSTNALQSAEATFRFGLSRVRENTEAIAIIRGEELERESSRARFRLVRRWWNRQSLAYLGLLAFGNAYGSLMPVLPILIAAPQYISGVMTLGALMQAAQAFQQLTSSLSWPVDNIGEMARCRASADRVLSLYEDMKELDAPKPGAAPRIQVDRSGDGHLLVEKLRIEDASGRVLIENLDMSIREGEKVLVAGDPAISASLFKVLGGLWPWGEGRVRLPETGGLLFLAERPFLPEGTLRAAISYPSPADAFPAEAVIRALERVGLGNMISRLEETTDWEQALPPRVQQQLGLARVLLQKPAWVFLEEATDAFDPEGERRIVEMLCSELPGATMLTISFHPELAKLHHRTVLLNPEGVTRIANGHAEANACTLPLTESES
jgi:putative ATP-binding cassette transporter